MPRVYVHVGLPKTGTTYLQKTLWASRASLSEQGVLVPGENQQFQRNAVYDLLGRRLRGVDQPEVPGSWGTLLESVRARRAEHVVLSEELLVHATGGVARRLVRDLKPAEVHVIVTVRDLERVLTSMWQQNLAKGRTWSWPEFVSAVRDPQHGPATAGLAFWLRYDLRHVLDTWAEVVPPQRIHVVVVPAAGAPQTALLERFAVAADLTHMGLTPPGQEVNTSVGQVEAELLRRLNTGLGGRLNERQYRHVIKVLKPVLRRRGTSGRPITVSQRDRAWVAQTAQDLVDLLENSSYDVVGDLRDLLPGEAPDLDREVRPVTDQELSDVAVAALVATAEYHAAYWWKTRRAPAPSPAGVATRLASGVRAVVFAAKVRALETADRNRLLARAAHFCVGRRSQRRQREGGRAPISASQRGLDEGA